MFNLFQPKKYHHLTKILVNQKNLEHNYYALSKFQSHAVVAPVLKSNAYGHGLVLAAKVFDKLNPPFLIVDSLYEAYELYKAGIKSQVLIIGYTDPRNFSVKKLPFQVAVFDLETAQALNKHQPGCKIHIFVDTGMNREGVLLTELETFLEEILKLKNLEIVGLCSHLADAENPSSNQFTDMQVDNYKKALHLMMGMGIDPQWRHLTASAGAFKVDDKTFNLIRAGKALYGYQPLEEHDPFYQDIGLKPALQLITTVSQTKDIKKGDRVGYDLTFTAPKNMKVAVLSAGYNDGINRALSNKGCVKINEHICPIIGRVSMNLTVVDVSGVEVRAGDKAEVYSPLPSDLNSVHQQAKAGSIVHELLIGIDSSLRRELV